MLNQNNSGLMWYDRRLLVHVKTYYKNEVFVQSSHQTKSGFVNNVYQKLFADVHFKENSVFLSHQEQNPAFSHPNQKLRYLYSTNLDKMGFLSSDLANLTLSLKTYTFLKQKGIHKIGDLVGYSQKSLLQLLNKNREMFVEVKAYLLTKN